jgi:hypothetical protein
MEPINPQNFQGYSKQELFALFREFLEEYYKQKEKELHEVSLIERIVRVEEELKSLRKEMSYRFEALLREMNARFEALLAEQRALREEMNARFEAITKEMNAHDLRTRRGKVMHGLRLYWRSRGHFERK